MKFTLSMYDYQCTWVEERAGESEMNLSEYMRAMATAGERQLVALENLADEGGRGELEANIVEQLPDDEADAIDQGEILEAILSPTRETTYTILQTNSQLEYSPEQEVRYLK